MIVIFYLVAGLGLTTLLGLIVLAAVPTFRLTISNLVVFVVGAVAGIFALANLIERPLMNHGLYLNITMVRQNELSLVLDFFCALVGGTAVVWLRMRLLSPVRKPEGHNPKIC